MAGRFARHGPVHLQLGAVEAVAVGFVIGSRIGIFAHHVLNDGNVAQSILPADGAEKQAQYNYIKEIVESYGYSFLNMNDADVAKEIGLDYAADFADYGNHLNAVGASKVTSYLGEYLTENYDFKDKRGDSQYASWDESYELYLQEYEEAVETINNKIANEEWTEVEGDE